MPIISFQIKKIATKLLSLVVKTLDFSFRGIIRLFTSLKSPFLFGGKLLLRLMVLPLYGQYLWVKNKFVKKTDNKRQKFLLAFTNRYVIHIILALLALGVTTSNLLAYEKREDYSQGALIYKIIGVEDIATSEDTTTPTSNETKVSNYTADNTALSGELATESQKAEDDLAQSQKTELTLTSDGSLLKPELVSTESAKTGRTAIKEYVVADGDTVSDVADKFKISINTVLWANNLSALSIIKPGQKLVIPPTSGVLHTIKKGDTLAKIATKYSATVSQIQDFNKIKDDSTLAVGNTIMVPGGRIIYTAKPTVARTYVVPADNDYSTPEVARGGMMYWPNGCRRISQSYRGWRHAGVDIACSWGTPIRAAEGGVVTRVQYGRTGYGYNIIVNHGDGRQTLYGHLSRIDVEVGQEVDKAQVIGLEGSTGRSTGPHLHFEVMVSGVRVNPLNYIR